MSYLQLPGKTATTSKTRDKVRIEFEVLINKFIFDLGRFSSWT
jgi:hypothetical protein